MNFIKEKYRITKILFVDETIDTICSKHPELIMKTSNDCHTYYNCSGEDTTLSAWTRLTKWIYIYNFWPSKYKHECHYPFVFSTKTLQCENYTDVDCGSRFLPTWECKYSHRHCVVMSIKMPSVKLIKFSIYLSRSLH